MKLDDEQKLVKKILNGNKKSFEELMRKYNLKIYNYILRMVRNEEVAVELTQEFFLKLYRTLSSYNFIFKFSTWSYRICYNMVIDHIRKNKMKISSIEDEIVKTQIKKKNLLESSTESGIYTLEKEEISKEIWTAIERIPCKYRELILLRYISGKKYNEIAEITDLPLGTIKNRIFKAKSLLREEMNNNGMSQQ
jgi:RNA polymerase sigma-70 factor (ECF subfamily)